MNSGHNLEKEILLLLHLCHEFLARLKGRNVVGRDNQCRILGNVASGLFCTLFKNKASKSTQENRLTIV